MKTRAATIRPDHRQAVRTGRRALPRIHILSIYSAFCVLIISAQAQIQQAWVAHYNNGITNGTNQALKMALDSAGNIYVTGPSQNANSNLGYVTIKYAPNGIQQWAQRFDSTNFPNATPMSLVLDHSTNVVVTGNAVTMEYGAGGGLLWTAPYPAIAAAVDLSNNVYITGVRSNFETIKLNPSGSNQWTAIDTGPIHGPDCALAIAVDGAGESFVAGDETYQITNFGFYECLTVVKYDAGGNLSWRNRADTSQFSITANFVGIGGILTDSQTNVFVETGQIEPYGGTYITLKYTSGGLLIWGQGDPTGSGSSYATGFALDGTGSVIVTGAEFGNTYPNSTYGTYKIDAGGSYTQTDFFPSNPAKSSAAMAVAVDSVNNYYVTGLSPGTNGFNDIVTIKYNPNGGQVWLERYSSPVPGNAAGNAIAVDNNGNVYVAGYDTGAGGGTDMVVLKYAPVTLQVLPNGTVQLQAQGSPGESFDVKASADLQTWQDLGSSPADTNGLFQFDDTNAPLFNARFYTTVPQ